MYKYTVKAYFENFPKKELKFFGDKLGMDLEDQQKYFCVDREYYSLAIGYTVFKKKEAFCINYLF